MPMRARASFEQHVGRDRNKQAAWVAVMKGAISKNASYFNSHRMMRRYFTEAYAH